MKHSAIILYVGVTLSLILSLTALIIVIQNTNFLSQTPPPNTESPPAYPSTAYPSTATEIPTTPTPPATKLTINYTETNRVRNKDTTKVTLTIDATYDSGSEVTIDYSQLYLTLYAGRMTVWMNVGTDGHQNSGNFNIGPSHSTQTFQLNFEFPTTSFNGMDEVGTYYRLSYNGAATIQWTNQDFY
jgi:hypothetical protein